MSLDYDKARKADKAKSDGVGRNVNKLPVVSPPTESQLELIKVLKEKLDSVGKDTSYLAEPETKFIAMHVINSLIRLCKKYHL